MAAALPALGQSRGVQTLPMFDCIPHEAACLYWIPTRLEFTPDGGRLLFRLEYGVAGTRRFKRAVAFYDLQTGESGLLDKRCGSQQLEFRSSPKATYFATMETAPRSRYAERGWTPPDESRGPGETIVRIERRATGEARYIYLRPFRVIVDFVFDDTEQHLYVMVADYTYHAVLRYDLGTLERELFFPKTLRLGVPGRATEIDGTQGTFFYLHSRVYLRDGKMIFLGAGPTDDALRKQVTEIGRAPPGLMGMSATTRSLPFEIDVHHKSVQLNSVIGIAELKRASPKWLFPISSTEGFATFEYGAPDDTIFRVDSMKISEFAKLDQKIWQFALSQNGDRLGYTYAGLVDKDKPRGNSAQDQGRLAAGLKIRDVATGAVTTVPVDKLAQSLANTPACWN